MNHRLIYDVATHADAASTAALFGFGIGFVVVASTAFMYWRGNAIGVAIKFLSAMSGIMLIVSALSVYENIGLFSKPPATEEPKREW